MKIISASFESDRSRVRGKFFLSSGSTRAITLVLIPGWPGNPDDILNICEPLARNGINVFMFNPRGFFQSEGIFSHDKTLEDIGAALRWLRQPDVQEKYGVKTKNLVLGGYSYGGAMAMAYAAGDASVGRVISIAGNDLGEFARELQRNPIFASAIREMLLSTRAPEGPVRFDMEAGIQELIDHQEVFGLRENANRLADKSLLIIGGWEDSEITIDQILLPLYRRLRAEGAEKVTFLVYHTDHEFSNKRQQLVDDIVGWLLGDEIE